MSSVKFLVIVVLVCATSAALAKPSMLGLDIVKDKTVCRTKIVYDENPERIPRTIKMLKCEDDPYEVCPANDGKSVPCCGAPTLVGGAKFSCIEVQDAAVVYNTKDKKEQAIEVAIGCSCIMQKPDKAQE